MFRKDQIRKRKEFVRRKHKLAREAAKCHWDEPVKRPIRLFALLTVIIACLCLGFSVVTYLKLVHGEFSDFEFVRLVEGRVPHQNADPQHGIGKK